VGEDEGSVEVDGLLVVLSGLSKLTQDEVELGTVVVNIGIVLVVVDGKLEVVGGSILVSCESISKLLCEINYAASLAYQAQGAS
jgi:hypothetical protein